MRQKSGTSTLRRSNQIMIDVNNEESNKNSNDESGDENESNSIFAEMVEIEPELQNCLNFNDDKLEKEFKKKTKYPAKLVIILSISSFLFLIGVFIFFQMYFYRDSDDSKLSKLSESDLEMIKNDDSRSKVAEIINTIYFSIGFVIWTAIFIILIFYRKQQRILTFLCYYMIGDTLNLWEFSFYSLNVVKVKAKYNIDIESIYPYVFIAVCIEVLFKLFLINKICMKYRDLFWSTLITILKESTIFIIASDDCPLDTVIIVIICRVMFNLYLIVYAYKHTRFIRSSWYKNKVIYEYFKDSKETLDSLKTGLLVLKMENETFLNNIEKKIYNKVQENNKINNSKLNNIILNNSVIDQPNIEEGDKKRRHSTNGVNSTKLSNNEVKKNDFIIEKCNAFFKSILLKIADKKLKENPQSLYHQNDNLSNFSSEISCNTNNNNKPKCSEREDKILCDKNSHVNFKLEPKKSLILPLKKACIWKYDEDVLNFNLVKKLFNFLEDINEELPKEMYDENKTAFQFNRVKDFSYCFKEYTFIGTFTINSLLDNHEDHLLEDVVYDLSLLFINDTKIMIRCDDISRVKSLETSKAKYNYRSKFLQKVSHEFKNPLTNIKELSNTEGVDNYSIRSPSKKVNDDYSTNNYINDEFVRNHLIVKSSFEGFTNKKSSKLKLIHSLAEYLLLLVKDFHTTANLDSNKKGLLDFDNSQEVSLSEILTFASDIFLAKLALNTKNIILETNYHSDNIFSLEEADNFMIDETRIKQILQNLLMNAYKFTNYGKVIIDFKINNEEISNENDFTIINIQNNSNKDNTHLYVNENGVSSVNNTVIKSLTITISDNGSGLDKEKVASLNSNSFSLGDSGSNSSGLGLILVKELTFLLGGSLKVESDETGTTFILEFMNQTKTEKNKNENKLLKSLLVKHEDSSSDSDHYNRNKVNQTNLQIEKKRQNKELSALKNKLLKHSKTQRDVAVKFNVNKQYLENELRNNYLNPNSNINKSNSNKKNFFPQFFPAKDLPLNKLSSTPPKQYNSNNNLSNLYIGNSVTDDITMYTHKIMQKNSKNNLIFFDKVNQEVKSYNGNSEITEKLVNGSVPIVFGRENSLETEKYSQSLLEEKIEIEKKNVFKLLRKPNLSNKNLFSLNGNDNKVLLTEEFFNEDELNFIEPAIKIRQFTTLTTVNENEFTLESHKQLIHNKTILIVDDEIVLRRANSNLIKQYLNSINKQYNILVAADGIEALYLYYKCLFDGHPVEYVFCDETMNYMDGRQLAKLINLEITKFKRKCNFYLVTAYEDITADISIVSKVIQKPLNKMKLSSIKF